MFVTQASGIAFSLPRAHLLAEVKTTNLYVDREEGHHGEVGFILVIDAHCIQAKYGRRNGCVTTPTEVNAETGRQDQPILAPGEPTGTLNWPLFSPELKTRRAYTHEGLNIEREEKFCLLEYGGDEELHTRVCFAARLKHEAPWFLPGLTSPTDRLCSVTLEETGRVLLVAREGDRHNPQQVVLHVISGWRYETSLDTTVDPTLLADECVAVRASTHRITESAPSALHLPDRLLQQARGLTFDGGLAEILVIGTGATASLALQREPRQAHLMRTTFTLDNFLAWTKPTPARRGSSRSSKLKRRRSSPGSDTRE